MTTKATEKQLADAMDVIAQYVKDTGIDVNIDREKVQIHWNGVNQLDCWTADGAKALVLLKQLEKIGMRDC